MDDPVLEVQKTAYYLLQQAAQKSTERHNIEVEVETENPVTVRLPTELIEILKINLDFEYEEDFDQVCKSLDQMYMLSPCLL